MQDMPRNPEIYKNRRNSKRSVCN